MLYGLLLPLTYVTYTSARTKEIRVGTFRAGHTAIIIKEIFVTDQAHFLSHLVKLQKIAGLAAGAAAAARRQNTCQATLKVKGTCEYDSVSKMRGAPSPPLLLEMAALGGGPFL